MKQSRSASFVTMIFLGLLLTATPAWAQSDLNGVWEIVEATGTNDDGEWKWENVQPSLYMFMDGYYSVIGVQGNEPRLSIPEGTTWDNITEEQMRSVCSGAVFYANSGTYEVSGSTLTTKPMVAKWPNFMEGGSAMFTYQVDSDILTLSGEGYYGAYTYKLRRLR